MKKKKSVFEGSMVALVTPFKASGEINEERLRFLINWHIKNKTDAILVCGTTGESATLSHAEHRRVIDKEHMPGRHLGDVQRQAEDIRVGLAEMDVA